MTEPMTPDLGALPWKPKRGLKFVREFNRWDVPQAGLLRSRRRRYHLFRCLDGASGQYSVWAYVPISRMEARELTGLAGERLRSRQIQLMSNRPLSIAVAEEGSGIIHRAYGRLDRMEPEPRLDPEVSRKVQEEIEDEAKAIRGMPIFAS